MNEGLAKFVRERARGQCEYCQLPEKWSSIPFEIDHIIARKHNGPTTEDNFALSCFYCNSAKGTNIAGIDPESGIIVRLFHPRRDCWEAHSAWNGAFLRGVTSE
jgi:HNH endonuclease